MSSNGDPYLIHLHPIPLQVMWVFAPPYLLEAGIFSSMSQWVSLQPFMPPPVFSPTRQFNQATRSASNLLTAARGPPPAFLAAHFVPTRRPLVRQGWCREPVSITGWTRSHVHRHA